MYFVLTFVYKFAVDIVIIINFYSGNFYFLAGNIRFELNEKIQKLEYEYVTVSASIYLIVIYWIVAAFLIFEKLIQDKEIQIV